MNTDKSFTSKLLIAKFGPLKKLVLVCLSVIVFVNKLDAQKVKLQNDNLVANKVYMSLEKFKGKGVVKVTKDSTVIEADEPTFVKIKNIDFKDGIIEASVLSRLLPNAAPSDRGFIGVTFRVNDSNSRFECIYLRPTNGRAKEQVRRNHSIQYFSFPDYKFQRLRKETPEMYESYADMELNK